jgi:hypothetical protein
MPRVPSASGGALPRWLIVVGSAAILFHLAAIIISYLDVPSGPWTKPPLPNERPEPEFAHAATGLTALHADYLRLAHSYLQFVRNRPADNIPGITFDAILRDTDGKEIKTLHFPDPDANSWVRHRQEILASGLAMDVEIDPPGSDVVPASGDHPKVAIWAREGEQFPAPEPSPTPPFKKVPLVLKQVEPYLVPRYRGRVRVPSELSVTLANSYARYLCRTYGADSAEIIRHTRPPVSYGVLLGNGVPDFDELQASFGRMK